MKTFVIGDIHGAHKALVQCLERSEFNVEEDRLICLGDIVDGFPNVKECVEELMKINSHLIIGNHDLWALEYFKTAKRIPLWLKQGGQATVDSYGPKGMSKNHLAFFDTAVPFIIWKDYLFVHGGIDPSKSIKHEEIINLAWNRQMCETAWKKTIQGQKYKFGPYKDIFCGHTTTQCFGIWDGQRIVERRPTVPLHLCNVWMLDTGAGWDGKLTIMDVETKQFWQSDNVMSLYPGEGRFKGAVLIGD